MLTANGFADFMKRLRRGEPGAVSAFVRLFEGRIQQAVRGPLRYYRLSRIMDASDISQAVLADFFRRDLPMRITVDSSSQLWRLLLCMARNKVLDEARKSQADCRDQRRVDHHGSESLSDFSQEDEPTPSKIVAGRELVGEIYRRMTEDERAVARLRSEGFDWQTIAKERGSNPDAVRKKLFRAMERVSHEMGLGRFTLT
jgi:RNA polymerase sigma factor (sigma-70 family)